MEQGAIIRVKGQGSVNTKPDRIQLNFKVAAINYDYEKSVNELNRRVAALRDAVIESGLDKQDLKTSDFRISSEYNYEDETRIFEGFKSRQNISITLPLQTSVISGLLHKLAEKDVQADVRFEFTTEETEDIRREVLRHAVSNATQKAEILADAAGKQLGKLKSIDHSWGEIRFTSTTDFDMDRLEAASTEMPEIEPEDIFNSTSVSMQWELI